MNSQILGLLAETSIHPGAGSDTGFVDLPVAREAATDYPVIVGSSVKGALRDRAGADWGKEEARLKKIFGEQENGGALIVSDARLLLLPVRSMTSHYKWITCPHLLERYRRDVSRSHPNKEPSPNVAKAPGKQQYLGAGDGKCPLFLEERQFTHAGDLPEGLADTISPLIRHEKTRNRLPDQLVVLHDDDFAWFARFGLAVSARNVLDEQKKTSRNLWYEETIPPDALFYLLLAEKNAEGSLQQILGLFDEKPYLQVGGNMTIGQGFFVVQPVVTEGVLA